MTVEGAANTEALLTYLDAVLCPALRPGRVVLMDNLRVHKAEAVRQRIEACGCRLVFLPRYSPDVNPIEGAFSKLEDVFTPGAGPHARGVGGGHRRGAPNHQRPRRSRLV
jgi:transposase